MPKATKKKSPTPVPENKTSTDAAVDTVNLVGERLSADPLIMIFDTGIDPEPLLSHSQWQRSHGWNFDTNASEETDWRTSSTWGDLQHQYKHLSRALIAAARAASGISLDLRQAEGMQLTKYGVGEYYKPHWDHFNFPNTTHVANDRIATLIWYVNDDFEGGETYFNDLNITVKPQRGRALLFHYPTAREKPLLRHEGCAVASGEKIIATIWLRAGTWP